MLFTIKSIGFCLFCLQNLPFTMRNRSKRPDTTFKRSTLLKIDLIFKQQVACLGRAQTKC